MNDKGSDRSPPAEPSREQPNDPDPILNKRAKFSIYVIGLAFIVPIICMCLAILALAVL